MKTINRICLTGCLFLCLTACDGNWQQHYYQSETTITNEQLIMVSQTTQEYLSGNDSRHLSDMYQFLQDNKVFDMLQKKGQLHTLLMVENDAFKAPEAERAEYIAHSHVTDICLSPSNLYHGERVLMWHQKFVTVGIDSLGLLGDLTHITFNGSPVKEVVKTTDGYIYVLDAMIETPISLQDYINDLPEEYSLFKDMVLASGGKLFDKNNSKPIGIDATGNTLYDTVWIYTNDFFDAKNFSLSSESLTATMLLFSNDVIAQAMAQADSALAAWDMTRDREVLMRWILEVAFYDKMYEASDLIDNDDEKFVDLKSIYDRQWRVEEQSLDLDNPIKVSNGIVYEVKKLRFPNNILIYRIKDFYRNYEYCTAEEKELYFKYDNLKNIEMKSEVEAWTPMPGVWPMHGNVTFSCYLTDASQGFYLDMQLIKPVYDEAGNISSVRPYLIPPGSYRFAMGFFQNMGVTMNVSVIVLNGSERVKLGEASVTVASTTEFHYDRGTFLSDTWPEGYKEVKNDYTHSKKNNYNTDGGAVMAELEIPDLKGDGSALPMIIKLEMPTGKDSRLAFHHWCLRPTSDNY